MANLYRGFEPKEGEMVVFLGVHALRWPWGCEIDPTIAFVEEDNPLYDAAPDLLAACEKMVTAMTKGTGRNIDSALVAMQIAIAKAKGKTHD